MTPSSERESKRNMDQLLADWAGRHALSPARADAIRHAARKEAILSPAHSTSAPSTSVHSHGDLSADWWKQRFRGVAMPLRYAADASRAGLRAALSA